VVVPAAAHLEASPGGVYGAADLSASTLMEGRRGL